MAVKGKEVADLIFEGGLPSDMELPEADSSKDFDLLGDEVDAEENEDELSQGDDGLEDSEPAPGNKKESVAEMLRQQIAQNNILMQRLSGQAPQPQHNSEDLKALDAGRALLNIQRNNPVLYGKLDALVANEFGGGQSQSQINGKLSALKQILKGEKYRELDSTPLFEVIDAVELVENNTKKENQQLIQVISNLQRDINSIKGDRESMEKQKVADRDTQAMLALKKAEHEFGIKLVKGSEEAEDFVLLVRNGKNPRTAFMKANGLKETDVVKRVKKEVAVDMNPKVAVTPKAGASRIADKLFPQSRSSSSIFKK